MSGDFNTYRRAATHCILGLIFQVVFGCGLLVYGAVGNEPAAVSGSIFALVGLLPWVVLLVLYEQHRRERIEAMEAEAFAATDAATASVFEESGEDLRQSARRLRVIRGYVVPASGLVFAAALLLAGGLRVGPGREFAASDDFVAPPLDLVGLTVGIAIAVIGFMFSRYTAGMARRPAWTSLQGGATVAAGTAVFGLLVAAGHVVDKLGSDAVLRASAYIAPGLLIVLGAEAVLNFLLELYRPRRPDEAFRPPFASRLLGPVASPEVVADSVSGAIDYQFGYEVSRSWMYRLLTRHAWVLVLFAGLVLWGMTAVVVVKPDQQAIQTRFGRVVAANLGPGLHLKLPWPIDKIYVPGVYEREEDASLRLVGRSAGSVREVWGASRPRALDTSELLWTNLEAETEWLVLVQPSSDVASGETQTGRDLSLMRVEVPVRYVIDDVEAWALLARDGAHMDLLDRVTQRVVMRYLVRMSVDDLLGTKRATMAADLRERLEREFVRINPKDNGRPVVRVLSVGVAGVAPPSDAVIQFEQVVEQEQKYQAQISAARADAIETLTEVVGSVDLAGRIADEIDRLNELRVEVRAEGAGDPDGRLAERVVEQELEIERLLSEAGGEAASVIAQANAERWARHMGERGDAALYQSQLLAYRANPPYFRAQAYLRRLYGALDGRRVYVLPADASLTAEIDLKHDRQSASFLQDDFVPSSRE